MVGAGAKIVNESSSLDSNCFLRSWSADLEVQGDSPVAADVFDCFLVVLIMRFIHTLSRVDYAKGL